MRLRVADGVGVEAANGVVYAAPLPDGPIAVLDGVAALIWSEGCRLPRSDVAAAVAAQTHEETASISPHVEGFLDDMVARGLLVEV